MIENKVYISASNGADNGAYHLDKRCERAPENPKPVPRSWVEDDNWHACTYCSDREVEYPGTNDMSSYHALVEMDPDVDLREVAER